MRFLYAFLLLCTAPLLTSTPASAHGGRGWHQQSSSSNRHHQWHHRHSHNRRVIIIPAPIPSWGYNPGWGWSNYYTPPARPLHSYSYPEQRARPLTAPQYASPVKTTREHESCTQSRTERFENGDTRTVWRCQDSPRGPTHEYYACAKGRPHHKWMCEQWTYPP